MIAYFSNWILFMIVTIEASFDAFFLPGNDALGVFAFGGLCFLVAVWGFCYRRTHDV